ncbi:MAG: VWA domain-containing protein, partial [Planctomycetota bacterium]
MQWLTPMTALYAAAVSVPLLLLLYFLKLKRREQVVSSTLLWKRAVQDLQVNAPFQKLRRNILLLLQLLMLLAILLAIAGPIISLLAGQAQRYVLLIDRSASMSATDVKPSRLEAAKEQAKIFVKLLREGSFFRLTDESEQAMVIAFDSHAKVMCNFTADKQQLIAAIESITAGDDLSSLAEPIVVARAFAQSPGEEALNLSAEDPAQLILFSDGQIRDLDQIVVGEDELVFHCVGESRENVAITAMQARRSYENPEEVDVFATVANYGETPVSRDMQLSINGNVRDLRSVNIPGRRNSGGAVDANTPGRVAVNFSLSYAEAGVLEVRHLSGSGSEPDCLDRDDAAWAILSPPRKLSVLLVTNGNTILESALKACSLAGLELQTPAEFDAADHVTLAIDQPYDFIVLDNHAPATFPKCRYLVFGHPPDGIDVSVAGQIENQVLVDWRAKHPVLKHVNLTNLFAGKCYAMTLPRDADVLAEFNETSALALVRRNGSVFLLAGFDVLQSNWPFEPSFVLFCYNAASYLGTQVGRNLQSNLKVGEPIVVEGLDAETVAKIDGPGMSGVEIASNAAGSIRFPRTGQVGPYSLSIQDQPP